jgi:hypothetical protein
MISGKRNFKSIVYIACSKIFALIFTLLVLFSPSFLLAEETICDNSREMWIRFTDRTKPTIPNELEKLFNYYYKDKLKDRGICIDFEKTKGLSCKLAISSDREGLIRYDKIFYNDKKNQINMYQNFEYFILDEHNYFFRFGSFDIKNVGEKMLSKPTLDLIAETQTMDTNIYGKKSHFFINDNFKEDFQDVTYNLQRDNLILTKYYPESEAGSTYKCTVTNAIEVVRDYNNLNQRFIDYIESKSKKNKF